MFYIIILTAFAAFCRRPNAGWLHKSFCAQMAMCNYNICWAIRAFYCKI